MEKRKAELRCWSPGKVREFLEARQIPAETCKLLFDGGLAGEMLLDFTKQDFSELNIGLKPAEVHLVIKRKIEYINGEKNETEEVKEATVSQVKWARKEQNTRKFWNHLEKDLKYTQGNLIQVVPTDFDEPIKGFKLLSLEKSTLKDLERTFMDEVAKFASACLNMRVNGTLYFGVGDAKEDKGESKGGFKEVVGMDVQCKPGKAQHIIDDWIKNHLKGDNSKYLRNCSSEARKAFASSLSPVLVIEIEKSNKVVVEIDVKPDANVCSNLVFPINFPNSNETKNASTPHYYHITINGCSEVNNDLVKNFIDIVIPQNQTRRLNEEKTKKTNNNVFSESIHPEAEITIDFDTKRGSTHQNNKQTSLNNMEIYNEEQSIFHERCVDAETLKQPEGTCLATEIMSSSRSTNTENRGEQTTGVDLTHMNTGAKKKVNNKLKQLQAPPDCDLSIEDLESLNPNTVFKKAQLPSVFQQPSNDVDILEESLQWACLWMLRRKEKKDYVWQKGMLKIEKMLMHIAFNQLSNDQLQEWMDVQRQKIMEIMMAEEQEVHIVKSEPIEKATAKAKKKHMESYEQEQRGCRSGDSSKKNNSLSLNSSDAKPAIKGVEKEDLKARTKTGPRPPPLQLADLRGLPPNQQFVKDMFPPRLLKKFLDKTLPDRELSVTWAMEWLNCREDRAGYPYDPESPAKSISIDYAFNKLSNEQLDAWLMGHLLD